MFRQHIAANSSAHQADSKACCPQLKLQLAGATLPVPLQYQLYMESTVLVLYSPSRLFFSPNWRVDLLQLYYSKYFEGYSKQHKHLYHQHHCTHAYQHRLMAVTDGFNLRFDAFFEITANWCTTSRTMSVNPASAVYNNGLHLNAE